MIHGTIQELATKLFENLGYSVIPYDEAPADKYGFLDGKLKQVHYDPEQPIQEIQRTLLHELGHLLLMTKDEDVADKFMGDVYTILQILDDGQDAYNGIPWRIYVRRLPPTMLPLKYCVVDGSGVLIKSFYTLGDITHKYKDQIRTGRVEVIRQLEKTYE